MPAELDPGIPGVPGIPGIPALGAPGMEASPMPGSWTPFTDTLTSTPWSPLGPAELLLLEAGEPELLPGELLELDPGMDAVLPEEELLPGNAGAPWAGELEALGIEGELLERDEDEELLGIEGAELDDEGDDGEEEEVGMDGAELLELDEEVLSHPTSTRALTARTRALVTKTALRFFGMAGFLLIRSYCICVGLLSNLISGGFDKNFSLTGTFKKRLISYRCSSRLSSDFSARRSTVFHEHPLRGICLVQ